MPSLRPRFWNELNAIVKKHNDYKSDGSTASEGTKAKRREVIDAGFVYLASAGCRLHSPTQFKEKHMGKLVKYWEKSNNKDIQTKISHFRVFAVWIRKPGMIKESKKYAINPDSVKRRYITNIDKTWTGNGVDVVEMVRKVTERDGRVGILAELGVAFGLRLKEALLFHPHADIIERADEDSPDVVKTYLHVRKGKGARKRDIEFEPQGPLRDYQVDLVARAKAMADRPGASMIPNGRSSTQFRRRSYYIFDKAGMTLIKDGITFHGTRHEYAVAYYERRTGVAAPLKGNPEKPDPSLDQKTREDLAENLGHSRITILGCYIGSRHRPVPQTGGPEAAKIGEAEGSKDVSDAAGAKIDPKKPDSKGE
jgi:site-specific recombinase XerC